MSLAEQLDTVTDNVAGTVDRHDTTETFDSTDPATGAVVGVFPIHDADAVRETVQRARSAAHGWWGDRGAKSVWAVVSAGDSSRK